MKINSLTPTAMLLRTACLGLAALAFSAAPTRAADILKADSADNLNLGTSWVGGVAPGTSDVAVWDHTVQNYSSWNLGAPLSWSGIQILDPALAATINDDGNTLTNGAAGIDLSHATTGFTLNCPITLGADQTWTVTNGQTLTVGGVVSGAAALTLSGGGPVLLSGANTYSGGSTIAGGVAEPDAATCFGTGVVTNNGGVLLLDVYPNNTQMHTAFDVSGNTVINAANRTSTVLTLDGAWSGPGTILITNLATGTTLTLGGNGNNGGSMNNFTGSVIISDTNSDGSPSAGYLRFNDGGANHNVGSANALFNLGQGSAQFTEKNGGVTTYFGALMGGPNTALAKNEKYVIGGLNLDSTFAGAVQSSSTLTKVGTGTFTLSGTNTYTGATTVSAGTLQIGDGATSGAGTLGTGSVINNATLAFNRPDDFEVDNAISGTGDTIKQSANTLTYGGTNTSSGTLVVNQGTLALNPVGSVLSAIDIAAGATFDVSQNSAFALASTLSGSGTVSGLLTAGSGGSISPGGDGAAGTLTFANGLNESGGVNNRCELSAPGSTNDQITVTGDLTLSGINPVVANAFGGGGIAVGTYTLITYSGNLNGGLTNLSLSVVGGFGVLTNPPGQIALIVTPPPRGPTNLTWLGNGIGNAWDINVSTDWVHDATPFTFLNDDSVTFDNTGSANPTVDVAQTVLPASVTVDASSDYTFTGNGDINGATGLLKTNTGTLTILTTNSYTGPTVVGGGTLAVSDLENGTLSSSIGAAISDPTNLVLNNATLNYIGVGGASDRGATLEGTGVGIVVSGSSANLTLNGTLTGPAALTVSGAGTLTLAAANSYSGGTVISNGVLALGSDAANSSGLGATNSPATLEGGTLQLFGYGGSTGSHYNTPYNPLVVPAGQTGTLQMFSRGPTDSTGLASSLSGGGTLTLVANYVRDNLDGDWSAFSGLINVVSKTFLATGSGTDEFRINNAFGYADATIFLNDGVIMDRGPGSSATIDIGALGGTGGATLGPGNKSSTNPTWRVGWLGTTNTFAGTIQDDGVSSVVKVGAGEWILTGQNTYSGLTTISNGVLALAYNTNSFSDGTLGSGNIDIAAGATLDVSGRSDGTLTLSSQLSGAGTVNGNLIAYGTVAPGDGTDTGTLTVTTNATLYGTTMMKLSGAGVANSDRLVAQNIGLGGTLTISTVGPRLQPGETFTLFSGALSGSFGSVQLPNYYTWDTNQLDTAGTITVAAVLPAPRISAVDFSTLSAGYITLTATNGAAYGALTVLSSTNLALPLSQWTPVQTSSFDGNGAFTGTITVDTNAPQSFYLIGAQ